MGQDLISAALQFGCLGDWFSIPGKGGSFYSSLRLKLKFNLLINGKLKLFQQEESGWSVKLITFI